DNEEIYILFNQDKKGVYKTGNTLEIIYNLEENKIHSINQPKLSFFNKLKNYLFASFSMIEKLSNFLGAPIGFTPENGVVQVYDNGEIFRYLNNPLESSDTTNSDNIIVRPDKTEVLKTLDYYLPVELNISSPHLRYLEYGIGNSFVANTYDFSVPQNHKYAQTYYLEDFHDVDENPSGRPSSNVF
ncbi:MAG: hypothetical protein PHO23_00280, partial [Candidatus Pacebacteria bacterium]|nr:hypothetical protein [Candidatus Paceibacterota bacterium]